MSFVRFFTGDCLDVESRGSCVRAPASDLAGGRGTVGLAGKHLVRSFVLRRCVWLVLLGVVGLHLTACTPVQDPDSDQSIPARPSLDTKADTVAMKVVQSLGGWEAWHRLPYIRFTFAIERGDDRTPIAHHLWDRIGNRYRVEWRADGGDTTFVGLFNTTTREGEVYANGSAVDSTRQDRLLQRAYRRYINDTYWLMAPVKLFDPGVRRQFLPDSSDGNIAVLRITFDNVGLTPGDQYWYHIDRTDYRVQRWAYRLQHMADDAAPSPYRWTDYETFESPAGDVVFATRKEAPTGNRAIVTDRISVPDEVPSRWFSDPVPLLAPESP